MTMVQLASCIVVGSFAGFIISTIAEIIMFLVKKHKEKKEDENE